MIAYRYDVNTKEFIEAVVAQIDPKSTQKRGTTVYLLPLNTTWNKPPATRKGEIAIFKNGNWVVELDYRGRLAYNTEHIFEINYIGDLKTGDTLLTDTQIKGLSDGTLIFEKGEIKPYEPTLKEQLEILESTTKLTRPVREMILAEDSGASEYNIEKAKELEILAEKIRNQ